VILLALKFDTKRLSALSSATLNSGKESPVLPPLIVRDGGMLPLAPGANTGMLLTFQLPTYK